MPIHGTSDLRGQVGPQHLRIHGVLLMQWRCFAPEAVRKAIYRTSLDTVVDFPYVPLSNGPSAASGRL